MSGEADEDSVEIGAVGTYIRGSVRPGQRSLDTTTSYLGALGSGTNSHARELAARWPAS